jgi:hypothetical protein
MSVKHTPSPARPTPARPLSPPPNGRPGVGMLSNARLPDLARNNSNLYGIVLTDVAGSAARDSRGLRRMRDDLYEIMAEVTAENGFDLESLPFDDTGDGLRLIVPLDLMPATRMVDAFVSGLAAGLREHRRHASEVARIRMRVCFDLGVVQEHRRSWTGKPLVRAARLIEAKQLREILDTRLDIDLAVVASDAVHEVTQQRIGRIPPEWFQEIRVRVKEFDGRGWLLAPPAYTACANCTYPRCLTKGAA